MNAVEWREKLAPLSDAELAKRLYLAGLVQRIDAELIAMKTLFGSGDEPLRFSPAPDTRLTALLHLILHLMMQEIKRRAQAQAQANSSHELTAEEKKEENHANHAENNGNH